MPLRGSPEFVNAEEFYLAPCARGQIGYLADRMDFLPALAQWHHREWAHLQPGESLEARLARLRGNCQRGQIPTAMIAYDGDILFGSAMLVAHDMDTRMELSPWLAGVFVVPVYRKRGIGAALVGRVVAEARTIGVRRLYLYTPGVADFYARLGWSLLERTVYRNTGVSIMSYALDAGLVSPLKNE